MKRSNSRTRRILAVLLSVIFLIGSMDMIAFASEDISYAKVRYPQRMRNRRRRERMQPMTVHPEPTV